jgi:hypothetical protein
MATINLKIQMSGYGTAQKDLTINDADAADIMAAFKAAIPAITNADTLAAFFASGIQSQIQGMTQDYRGKQNPAPIPPVEMT